MGIGIIKAKIRELVIKRIIYNVSLYIKKGKSIGNWKCKKILKGKKVR